MTFQSALTAGNLDSLRGTASVPPRYAGAQYLSVLPNTTIFAARVNGSPSGDSFAQITFDTVTTGAYTDIAVGMRVLISHTNDRRAAFFDGRARKAATSTILYINETSEPIADNDYIFVIEDYPIREKQLRDDAGTFKVDYEDAYRGLPPVIGGVRGAYAGLVNADGKLRVPFAASAVAAESGATISSYAYTLPGSATVISGATNTANVTVDFAAGCWFVKLVVTDSGGRSSTLYIKVWAEDPATSTTLITGFSGAQISCALNQNPASPSQGWTASIAAFTGIDSLLNNTAVCIWDDEYLNGAQGSIGSNVRFVGRLRRESNQAQASDVYSRVLNTTFQLEGEGQQLARIDGPRVSTLHAASPSKWGEIKNWTPWRAIVLLLAEFSTFLLTNSLTFDATADTFLAAGSNTDGQNMLNCVHGIAQGINAEMQFAPWSAAEVARHAGYLATADRNSLPTILNYTTEDMLDSAIEVEHVSPVGFVDASGGMYTASGGTVTPLRSFAPGIAKAIGEGQATLTRQLLQANQTQAAAQNELNDRAGNHWRRLESGVTLPVSHPDAYGFLIPAVNQWYTWTFTAADSNLRSIAYDTATRWLLMSVSMTHNNETGTKDIQATYLQETSGFGHGKTIAYPTSADNGLPAWNDPGDIYLDPLDIGGLEEEELYLLYEGVSTLAAFCTDGYVYITHDFESPSPTYTRTSLGVSGTPVQFVVDAFSPLYQGSGSTVNGWLATTSGIYRITDVFGSLGATLQHTFLVAISGDQRRDMDFSFGTQNWGIAVSYHADDGTYPGVYAAYTTNGTTWTEGLIAAGYDPGGIVQFPGLYVSSKTPGLAYTAADTGTGGGGTDECRIYRTTNYGASWSAVASPAGFKPVDWLAGSIHLPFHDNASEAIAYFGGWDYGTYTSLNANFLKRKNADGSISDITPVIDGKRYGAYIYQKCVHSCPINRQAVVASLYNFDNAKSVVVASRDGGTTWTTAIAPEAETNAYRNVQIAGDNEQVLYLWSTGTLRLGYSGDFCVTIEDKTGNMAALGASGGFVGICGGG